MLSPPVGRTAVMGVLNVTPDSFSDGGMWLSHDAAVAHGLELIAEGADIVDVGGESTRPGAVVVSAEEEIARVVPVVRSLASHARISIDTSKFEVAVAAVAAGATMINDVSASLHSVAADAGVAWVAMHMQGEPGSMQASPSYGDVVKEVSEFLIERADIAKHAGVQEIWIDPGIGFGKTVEHNLSLLKHLDVLTQLPFPVVVGASRKAFLGKVLGSDEEPVPVDQRLEASIAAAVMAISQGVAMVRVHDVRATARAARVATAIKAAA